MSKTIEELFSELTSGLVRKVDFERWPEHIFFFRGEECLFEYNFNFVRLWCDYEKVWKVLKCERRYNYLEVQSFIKNQVEQHFKLQAVTPDFCHF